MEPSQLNHLKEAAADIRASIIGCQDIVIDYMTHGSMDNMDKFQLAKMDKKLKNAERALTRIEMCLKEIG